jgi:hypothetical protein
MVRGTGAVSYTYLDTVYTTLGIRAHPTRPTRPEGAPGLVPKPAQARLFVRPVGSTAQAEALDAIHFTAKKMELHTTMYKGDIRLINNMGIFHRREAFEDKAGEIRHLIRIWLNNEMMYWKLPRPLRLA